MAEPPALSFRRCASRMRCRSARSSSVDARGRDPRHGRLEHAADVEQLVLQIAAVASGSTPAGRRGGRRPARCGNVPWPCRVLEQADGFQQAEGVADRAAADAEPFASSRSAGSGRPGGSVPSRISTRMRSAISSATRVFLIGSDQPAPRRVDAARPAALDTSRGGCQTAALNWFDHWASVAGKVGREKVKVKTRNAGPVRERSSWF